MRSKILRSPSGRPLPSKFYLRGSRSITHRATRALLDARGGGAFAWGRPGEGALVVMRAEDFAELTGREVHRTTFAPSRFCSKCAAFIGPLPARCMSCSPPTIAAKRTRTG